MIQITFLNMLIAVMSNTYDRVSEDDETNTMRSKIELLNDYRWINGLFNLDRAFQYIFIVRPMVSGTDDDSWEGKISNIKTTIESNFKNISKEQKDRSLRLEKMLIDMDSNNDVHINLI